MKVFILGAILLLISAASLADTAPGGAPPPATPGATSGAKVPPGGDDSQQRSGAKAPGNSCRKAAFGTCKGCSITCGQGEKAVCSEPLYSWNSNKCVRDAACRCKARRS
jgi:hypothetical protein